MWTDGIGLGAHPNSRPRYCVWPRTGGRCDWGKKESRRAWKIEAWNYNSGGLQKAKLFLLHQNLWTEIHTSANTGMSWVLDICMWSAQPSVESIVAYVCSVTQLCLTIVSPGTVTCQAPLSMGFPRQEYWSGLPFPFPGNLLDPRIEPPSPALVGRVLLLSHLGSLSS